MSAWRSTAPSRLRADTAYPPSSCSSDTNESPSRSRSWSSRGSHTTLSCSTLSRAHSVVPLKPMTSPVVKWCTSTVISLMTKTSFSMPLTGTTKRSPETGSQRSPASESRRASSMVSMSSMVTSPRGIAKQPWIWSMTERPGLEALDESTFETVLCVVAHPDDLEYGTAAAVEKWVRAGKTVTYLLVTRGEAGIDTMPPAEAGPLREQEERTGAARVGVDVVEFLDGFADGVVEFGLALRRAIAREIRIRRPDLVVTMTYADRFPGGSVNQADHRAVGLAVVDARSDAGNRWIFPDLVDEGHEPWKVAQVLVVMDPEPTHYVDVSDHVDAAVASLSAHEAYLAALGPDYPDPADLLGRILGGPADVVGVPYAVTGRLLG